MRLCPSPGRPFPFCGSTRRSRSRTSTIQGYITALLGAGPAKHHSDLRRRMWLCPIRRRHAGRRTHRVACLAVGSCLITASHSMQYNYNKTCSTHFYQYQTQTYTRPLLISVLLQLRHVSNQNQNTSERLLCMECPRSSDVCVRFVRS